MLNRTLSNFEGEIPWTQKKLNSWKTFSMHYVQLLASKKQSSCSLMQKDPTLWYLWLSSFLNVKLIYWHWYLFRSKFESKSRSIKVLDYAMSGTAGSSICEAFVEALGLKTLFMTFMGKVYLIYLTVIFFWLFSVIKTTKKIKCRNASIRGFVTYPRHHILFIVKSAIRVSKPNTIACEVRGRRLWEGWQIDRTSWYCPKTTELDGGGSRSGPTGISRFHFLRT